MWSVFLCLCYKRKNVVVTAAVVHTTATHDEQSFPNSAGSSLLILMPKTEATFLNDAAKGIASAVYDRFTKCNLYSTKGRGSQVKHVVSQLMGITQFSAV